MRQHFISPVVPRVESERVPAEVRLSGDEFGRTPVAAVISYNNGGTFTEQAAIIIDAPTDGLMLVTGTVSIGSMNMM